MSFTNRPRYVTRWAKTGIGPVRVTWSGSRVISVELGKKGKGKPDPRLRRELEMVRQGRTTSNWLKIDRSRLSDFSARVLELCARIRPGAVRTYGELARIVGRPGAARAVGRVLAQNPFPILVPCHRVVGNNGRLTGFSAGLKFKERLLRLEGWQFAGRGMKRRLML